MWQASSKWTPQWHDELVGQGASDEWIFESFESLFASFVYGLPDPAQRFLSSFIQTSRHLNHPGLPHWAAAIQIDCLFVCLFVFSTLLVLHCGLSAPLHVMAAARWRQWVQNKHYERVMLWMWYRAWKNKVPTWERNKLWAEWLRLRWQGQWFKLHFDSCLFFLFVDPSQTSALRLATKLKWTRRYLKFQSLSGSILVWRGSPSCKTATAFQFWI